MKKNIIVILLFLLLHYSASFTADFTVGDKNSSINWTKGIIISRGRASINDSSEGQPGENSIIMYGSINRARISTYDRARDSAIDDLISSIRSIQVDSESRLIDIIRNSNFAQKKIYELLTHSLKIKMYPIDFFSTECEATLKMGDLIASLPYDYPQIDFPEVNNSPLSTTYTGLIIDCRNINVKPMLCPSIYTEDGLEIYGRHFINLRYASDKGMASYCFSEKDALKNDKSGNHPYYAVAIKSIKNCPVISETDYRRINGSRDTINNLKRCNVIIILNK